MQTWSRLQPRLQILFNTINRIATKLHQMLALYMRRKHRQYGEFSWGLMQKQALLANASQPAFQAINLEPEDNVDEQIDTTKQLHVDEALKRFHQALRHHARGPQSRAAAEAAYDHLFESEIFRYREARTDYERAELHANGEAEPQDELSAGLDVDAGGADGVAASLSMALYLGYKGIGDLWLDKLKDLRESDYEWKKKLQIAYDENGGKQVLDNWAKALDQDPSDPEFWRRAARFTGALNSGRLERFCLEAAIELDDDPAAGEVEPPAIAEALSGERLKEKLQLLGDDMALSHPSMDPWTKKKMPDMIKSLIDPMPTLPDPTQTLTPPPSSPAEDQDMLDEGQDGTVAVSSWSQLGRELMKHLEDTRAALLTCESVLEEAQADVNMAQAAPEAADGVEQPDPDSRSSEEAAADKPDTETADQAKKDGAPSEEPEKEAEKPQNERSESAPVTRKRSQSAAGLAEIAEEEAAHGTRSKRIRRRETTDYKALTKAVEKAPPPGPSVASQLQPYQESDSYLFGVTQSFLENIGVKDADVHARLKELKDSATTEDRMAGITPLASKDLRVVMTTLTDATAKVLLNKEEQASLGLSSFLEHAKSGSQDQTTTNPFNERKGIKDFVEEQNKNRDWMTGGDAAYEWARSISRSYAEVKWSDEMKTLVVQMLNQHHAGLFERVTEELDLAGNDQDRLADLETLVPMLFELHIDIYERITNPNSVVEYAVRVETKDRLNRWLDVASRYVNTLDNLDEDPICVRFMWASVMAASLADEPVREHMLLLWTSLRDFLTEHKCAPISLPNNVVMPHMTAEAADREISKLTTMDFFLGLFQDEQKDPVDVINTLEPVLNPDSVRVVSPGSGSSSGEGDEEETEPQGKPIAECAGQELRDLWKFLVTSSTELRLFLWSQLGQAYAAIDYKTKKFSCHLKAIEMIISDLDGETYSRTPDESRRLMLMRTLKSLDEQLVLALTMGINEPTAFDIIDQDHLKASAGAVAKVNCLLHVVAMCEDEIRIGITASPTGKATFQSFSNRLREMQVRAWTLQYTLLNAGISQSDSFISPDSERAGFLAAVHRVIGLRKYCFVSNKIFLNIMRREILRMKDLENWEDYLEQVLYDLYGLKLGVGAWAAEEHGCLAEPLEKGKTLQLVERVMMLANRMPMKDLLKSDLKTAIDHMQQTIGQLKSTPPMSHNLRNFNEYLKKPIHPLRLYRALSGSVDLDAVNIPPRSDAILAKHGWFNLLGMIALAKFKGVDLNRRQTPGATDDLRVGTTFLRLQLQFTPDRWDTWFRLAECFDYELDEAVLWSADKINKDRAELLKFQRHAIHCYTLALSHSRNVDLDLYEGDLLHDLYHRFGMRMYASSREPFAMEPFKHAEQERVCIEPSGISTFRRILHVEMKQYKVWKFAAKLFQMAMKRQPTNWQNPYMLAKCYWKMYTAESELDEADLKSRPKIETVIGVLKKTIEVAYNARKSRRSEPILEPHYKIVSVLHKLVKRGDLPAKEAADILAQQPFGVKFTDNDHYAAFPEPEDWEVYVISNLTKLQDKDKSNWQHRIIMRHAKIVFDDNDDQLDAAKAAFNILSDSMLTKTMVMNVWKCEAERPGRHHVYTERYTRFVTNLLVIMLDRANMEQLLKRIRKKSADFYHFNDLWHTCCTEFVKILRKTYGMSETHEEVFKSMSSEEFEIVTDRITEWAAGDGPHTQTFSCMKDAIELKKLNGGLTRAGPIDDLINDCYSKIYLDVRDSLPGAPPSQIISERNKAKETEADSKPVHSALSNLLNPAEGPESRGTTPTPQDSERAEGSTRRRTGIRRPDVVRRAEAAIAKAMEPRAGPAKSRVGSMSSKRGSQTPAAAPHSDEGSDEEGVDAQVRREAADVEMKEDEGDGQHDVEEDHDADDESDLSDVPDSGDDDMPPGFMFPNLNRADATAEASGDEADSESEGDEEEAEEEEGEEEAEEGDPDETLEHDHDEGTMHTADEGTHEDEEGDAEMVDVETAPQTPQQSD